MNAICRHKYYSEELSFKYLLLEPLQSNLFKKFLKDILFAKKNLKIIYDFVYEFSDTTFCFSQQINTTPSPPPPSWHYHTHTQLLNTV